jgi:FMN phosphatase YigB (HAD superfamily)
VLLVGDNKELVIARAEAYGWTNAVHVSDYCAANPTVSW